MGNENITLNNTQQAKDDAKAIYDSANQFKNYLDELSKVANELRANWEGDSPDLDSIILGINEVAQAFDTMIIPTMTNLSTQVTNLAEQIEALTNNTVEDPNGGGSGNGTTESSGDSGNSGGESSGGKEKPGFWAYHGQNYKNCWDYSGCDAGLDYVGATVSGIVKTAGETVNFVVDGASEFLGWLFG